MILCQFMKGIKNIIGNNQKQKYPILRNGSLTIEDLDNTLKKSKRIMYKDQIRLAYLLFFTGGLRISEVLNLKARDISIIEKQIYLNVKDSKTGTRLTLFLIIRKVPGVILIGILSVTIVSIHYVF